MTALDTVRAFLAAASARDYDTALPMLADDVVYQNMPLPPVQGHQAVHDTLEWLLALTTGSEWVIHREVATADLVMNERTDRFCVEGRWLELPVVGVFELRDGRITAWRDYFDLDSFMKQLAPTESAASPSGD